MFEVKDMVVYPGHGVAIVDEIIEKQIAGTSVNFFKLIFLYKDMTILLPVNNIHSSGVRYPGKSNEVVNAFDELSKMPTKKLDSTDFTPSGWNKRNKDYQNKIQGGQLMDLAQMYRDLRHIAQHKELSFGEKKYLQMAEDLFIQEIQLITDKKREIIIQELNDRFNYFFYGQTDDNSQQSMI